MARKFLTAIDAGGNKIQNVADGTVASDVATKGQLDAVTMGLDFKESVRAATTANVTLSGTQTIDGVSLVAGDRVLVKNQTAPVENGIYVVASGSWSRAADADSSAEVDPGMTVVVEEGSANADTLWILTTNAPVTLGTTGLTFAKIAPATVTTGTSKFGATIGDGVATSIAVTHNLGTTDVVVEVFNVGSGATEVPDVVRTSTNVVTLTFASAPASNSYRVVVIG